MQKDLRKSALWRHRRKISPDAPIEKFSFTKAYGTSLVYEEYRKKAERELGNGIDGSMIDATVAMRMRLDGHAKGDAINAIYRNSPWAAERSTREDKIEYVQTIARVSYGALGDMTIARLNAEEVRRKRQAVRREKEFFCGRKSLVLFGCGRCCRVSRISYSTITSYRQKFTAANPRRKAYHNVICLSSLCLFPREEPHSAGSVWTQRTDRFADGLPHDLFATGIRAASFVNGVGLFLHQFIRPGRHSFTVRTTASS